MTEKACSAIATPRTASFHLAIAAHHHTLSGRRDGSTVRQSPPPTDPKSPGKHAAHPLQNREEPGGGLMRAITVLVLDAASVTLATARELTLDERVAAQRAIEQVYWNHRIWPTDNPGPKPPLSAVLSDDALRAKVAAQLTASDAAASKGFVIDGARLQNEMNRIAASSHAPDILRELFDALGNDPFLIAETL